VELRGAKVKTFQNLAALKDNEGQREKFVFDAIEEHKDSAAYKAASIAEKYYAKKNVTIMAFQKVLYNMAGQAVPDLWSANYKLRTHFFRRFVIQETQYILANGVTFQEDDTKKKLGSNFDTMLQKAAKKAKIDSVSFLFWNLDHVEVFCFCDTPTDPGFVPLYDEDTGKLRAGVRYWHPDDNTTRATLYEEDGYTEFKKAKDKISVVTEKRSYKKTVISSKADGVSGEKAENYSKFPIVPLYANDLHESELEGHRESIDCYDYIKSGLANDIDDTSGFYWVLKNSGGMDDVDVAKFIERMRTVRGAAIDTDQGEAAEAHTLSIPTEAREKMLAILRKDLYEDFQVVNVSELSASAKTATEINAAYQPMDDKSGDFEYLLIDAIQDILSLAGIDDEPSFRYNKIVNQTEETNMIVSAAAFLTEDMVVKKLPFLTPEEAQEVINDKGNVEVSRYTPTGQPTKGANGW
jgi:SPP1 family phage portal protein